MRKLYYQTFDQHSLPEFNASSETKGAIEVLDWTYSHYHVDELVYACSFGIEGMVLIDLISKVQPEARLAFLDTDMHFKETYQLIDEVKAKYPRLRIDMVKPELSLAEQADRFDGELWKSDPNRCCEIRKVLPLKRVLSRSAAWISGLRREQSETRRHTDYINIDHTFQAVKICPLIHWTWKDVWRYTAKNDLPYNPLHDTGYPSIGCYPCTQPAFTPEDMRSGRWSGSGKTECGLHT